MTRVPSLSWFYHNSVFNKHKHYDYPNEMLAIYYHRSAATLYLIYAVWGMFSFFHSIPTFELAAPDFKELFPLYIVPIALTSMVGATFFPRTGRLEMFASAGLASLVTFYITLSFIQGFQGDIDRIVNSTLNLAHLVVPISRVAFIFRTLSHNNANSSGKGK